jgi:hypothetical protein
LVWVIAGVGVLAGLTVLVVKFAPDWLASTDGLDPKDKSQEIGRVRTALLAVLAGAIATIGAIYTARSYALNRESQITERFTRAVEQLGHEKTPVKVGGIYALERIARDSPADHGPIVEVLTAYLREHARRQDAVEDATADDDTEIPHRAQDVQAALTVLGRRNPRHDDPRVELRLSGLDLRGASLRGGNFERARFRGTRLEGAKLEGAHLENARLRAADLKGADLESAPDLNLAPAHLEGANLAGAHLEGAKLAGVVYDSRTRWPDGFDPEGARCRLVDERKPEPKTAATD